ncbi:MAG: hypothetical protein ACUVV6_03960 [Thermoplasmatota archaeon]
MRRSEESPVEAEGDFPKELLDFFQTGEPRLLVVKGRPRVGKSLFSIGLAASLAPPPARFLLLTKDLEDWVLNAHPWVRDALERQRSPSLSPSESGPGICERAQPQAAPPGEPRMRTAREILDSIFGEASAPTSPGKQPSSRISPGRPGPQTGAELKAAEFVGRHPPQGVEESLSAERAVPEPDLSNLKKVLGDRAAPELVGLYRALDAAGRSGGAAVVNRFDRLAERYGASLIALGKVLKEDIVRERRTHLLLVLEKPANVLDSMADGTVTLKDITQGDEFLGHLEIGKLGGSASRTPRCMYNLKEGRFRVLRGVSAVG